MRGMMGFAGAVVLACHAPAAHAENILLSNDDGLTSNVVALYHALKAAGHDVIVSIPCANQSGMGTAVKFDGKMDALAGPCRNLAGKEGDPGAGPVTRPGFENDFFYVNGTPVMATLFGLDVLAAKRWGRAPDLVLSGPNEGQNVGPIVLSSGTVSNAQYAALRGLPAIAVSAGVHTTDDDGLANPKSREVAALTVKLVDHLKGKARGGALLPQGIALNVNFPNELVSPQWRRSRIGTYRSYLVSFVDGGDPAPGAPVPGLAPGTDTASPRLSIGMNQVPPTAAQARDEAAVYKKDIAVSVMQAGYEVSDKSTDRWLDRALSGL